MINVVCSWWLHLSRKGISSIQFDMAGVSEHLSYTNNTGNHSFAPRIRDTVSRNLLRLGCSREIHLEKTVKIDGFFKLKKGTRQKQYTGGVQWKLS